MAYSQRLIPLVATLAAAMLLGGCAAQRHYTDGMKMISEGQREQGLKELRLAQQAEPDNPQYRMSYLSQQALFARDLLEKADAMRNAGDTEAARSLYIATLQVDPANDRARRGLQNIEMDIRHRAVLAEVEKLVKTNQLEAASERLHNVLRENPANTAALTMQKNIDDQMERVRLAKQAQIASQSVMRKPVTLQFRDANLRMVFEALSRTTGLNVIFDRDVRNDLKTTIFVNNAAVEDTVDLILLQSQLEKKVLNANTLFIYPATAAKQKEYQDLKVRTFMLSNADPKYVQNLLKTILKIKDVVIDERTGALVIRDTPDAISVAEKMIAAHDVADPEVMLEVEVLEVTRDRLQNMGIQWPTGATISTPTDSSGALTLGALRNLTRDQLLITPFSLGINFNMTDTDANILASPRIRARNKEKAKILIGDKVPVITNTVTPVSTGTPVVTGSVQYLDVGIKLEVEPQVYSEGEVGIKINLEVSNIAKEISGPSGSLAYQIGTRSAQTNLRLRDGETQILAGLISSQDRSTAAKVPGVGQLPVLGRLFSNNNDDTTKSEIVLSITPHIVRAPALTDINLRDVYSGTETTVRENPLRLDPIGSVRDGAPGGVGGGTSGAQAPVVPMPAVPNPATPSPGPSGAAIRTAPMPVNGYPGVTPRVPPTPYNSVPPATPPAEKEPPAAAPSDAPQGAKEAADAARHAAPTAATGA